MFAGTQHQYFLGAGVQYVTLQTYINAFALQTGKFSIFRGEPPPIPLEVFPDYLLDDFYNICLSFRTSAIMKLPKYGKTCVVFEGVLRCIFVTV